MAVFNRTKADLDRHVKVVKAAFEDGKLGPEFRKLAKTLLPDIEIPEDRVAPLLEPMRTEASALKDELAALKKSMKDREDKEQERSAEDRMKKALDDARSKFHLTEEGFKLMTDRMVETKNYSDAEAAAAWVAAQNPPPKAPTSTFGSTGINWAGDAQTEFFKGIHDDPLKWQDRVFDDFMRDPNAFERGSRAA